jgi:hypothetical protein
VHQMGLRDQVPGSVSGIASALVFFVALTSP